jgi:anaerobic magnesium-protoporphyrin IX monomethyl ester cyclase
MANVLIINSPLFQERRPEYNEDYLPPIGLGYIATHLRNHGHSVDLVDSVADNLTIPELVGLVELRKPDAVALNVFTTNYNLVRLIVESINHCSTRIIIGGLSTRTLYTDIFSWSSVNHIDVVCGDGELITSDLVNNSVTDTPLATNESRRYFLVSRDSAYFVTNVSIVPLDRDFFSKEPICHPRGYREVSIVTSRGCLFNCAFCAAARSLNKDMPVREMSEDAVVRDLQGIRMRYPDATHIRILDDLFLKNSRSIEKAINVFSRCQFKWRAMAHVQTFLHTTDDVIIQMRQRGCVEIFMGVESGSPRILRKIHKTADVDVIKNSLVAVMKAGIAVKAYFIYGFPGETRDDFEMTYQLAADFSSVARSLGVSFRTSVFQFRPYHGTELYYELMGSSWGAHDMMTLSETRELSSSVGRSQFNFDSGNYSKEDVGLVHDYIKKTMALEVCGEDTHHV